MNADLIKSSLTRGIKYLVSQQSESGAFPTHWSERLDMALPQYIESPFVTGLILMALGRLGRSELPRKIVSRGLSYLVRKRQPNGLFLFLNEGIEPDVDSTCLLNSILQKHLPHRFCYSRLAQTISGMTLSSGFFRTWLQDESLANIVDPVVNVNVVRFLHANQIRSGLTIARLQRAIEESDFFEGSHYYESGLFLPYFACTLPSTLRREIMPRNRSRLLNRLESRARADCSILDDVLLLYVLASSGFMSGILPVVVERICQKQNSDGSWPSYAAFRAFNYWGDASLCTAVAIQALATFTGSVYLLDRLTWAAQYK